MYVVTHNGKKLPVDDSTIDYEKDDVWFHENVGLYTDDTVLKPIWYAIFYKVDFRKYMKFCKTEDDIECAAVKVYDHEPTKEEILWAMSTNGLGRFDHVTISTGYSLGMTGD